MEDLAEQVKNILNSPEGQKQLQNIASMFGGNGGTEGTGSALQAQSAAQENVTEAVPEIDVNMIANISRMMKNMNTNDKNTQLLLALKPHCSELRQRKVDRAVKMLRLFSMLPLLRQSGLFSEFEL